MKRTIAAIVLMMIILSLCIAGTYMAKQITENNIHMVEEIKASVEQENFSGSLALSHSLQDRWQKSRKVLCLYMSHTRLESIEEAISSIIPLIQYKETGSALSTCDRIIVQLKGLQKSEIPLLENIL